MTDREAALEAELKASRLEVKLLKEKIDALVRMIYGRKSEKLDPNQLMLLKELEGKIDETPAAPEPPAGVVKKARRQPTGPRVPDHLPVKEAVLDPEEVKAEPQAWRLMGEEVSEQLDYEPGRFWKKRLIRRKYVRRDAPFTAPVIAPLPPCMQERCLATPELIAHVVAAKYVDHQPLYRQEQIYKRRHGVDIPRPTLCRWVALAAETCQLVYEAMKRQQTQSPYLQIDETPIRYLEPGRGKAPQGYFWVSSVPGGDVIYHWHASRTADCLEQIIPKNFRGTLQCDGYAAYPSLQKQRAGPDPSAVNPIELAACWAHVRRKFFEAQERDPRLCGWILVQIGQLYRVERRLRERRAGPRLRQAVRAAESAPVVARLKKALFILRQRYLPQSGLAKAIDYALGQWPGLEVFLSNGSVAIDNNAVENAIRPTKLGMKNWMFIGAEEAGPTSAILFTLIESAKRHGLEPYAYILHLLRSLPAATNWQINRYTPAAVAKEKLLESRPAAA